MDKNFYSHRYTHGLGDLYSNIYRHTDPNALSDMDPAANPYPDKYVDVDLYNDPYTDGLRDPDLHADVDPDV